MADIKTWQQRIGAAADAKAEHYTDVAEDMQAEIADLRAALATCAEEARREARKQAEEYLASVHVEGMTNNEHYRERMFIEIVRADEAAGMKRFTRVAAQRTAGGDAAKIVDHVYEHVGFRSRDRLIADVQAMLQPVAVAVAAAQADDVYSNAYPDGAIYQIESTLKTGMHWRDTNKETYDTHYPEHRRVVYAAPTAQPSHETIVRQGDALVCTACGTTAQPTPSYADIDKAAWAIQERKAAQPTLPDDERAQLREALENCAGVCQAYAEQSPTARAAAAMADAALRQPGALPRPQICVGSVLGHPYSTAQEFGILERLAATGALNPMGARQDEGNYCRILTAPGMEEEGDPVAEVERLVAAAGVLSDELEREMAHKSRRDAAMRPLPQDFGIRDVEPAKQYAESYLAHAVKHGRSALPDEAGDAVKAALRLQSPFGEHIPEQAKAWCAIFWTMCEVCPDWYRTADSERMSTTELAVATIRALAARAAAAKGEAR